MKRSKFIQLIGLSSLSMSMISFNDLFSLSKDLPSTEKMPMLFIGHGNPMNAIEENSFVQGFRETAKKLPKPTAIVCISAHWETKGTQVTAMQNPQTIHDFGGFPQALFDVQYPAPGSPELAKSVKEFFAPTPVELDQQWGLDHGTWTTLIHFFPKADVPIIQLSLDYTLSPQQHYDLAKKLQILRSKGVLIIGSGNVIHNLGLVDFRNINKENYGYDWAIEARELTNKWILEGNHSPLIDYKNQGKAINLAAPTPDHYLPLLYILSLQEKSDKIELFNDKLVAGSLSMTSVIIR
jgi:4,5-DOPA dioxygenase extradiol